MTIDPYETIIKFLLGESTLTALVSTRISVKHKYGDGWSSDQIGVEVTPNGGRPDLYKEVQRVTVQARIYCNSVQEGMGVWKVLSDISRANERKVVTTSNGNGMLYWFHPTSAPALVTDYDLDKNIILINFDAQVGEMVSA